MHATPDKPLTEAQPKAAEGHSVEGITRRTTRASRARRSATPVAAAAHAIARLRATGRTSSIASLQAPTATELEEGTPPPANRRRFLHNNNVDQDAPPAFAATEPEPQGMWYAEQKVCKGYGL